MVDAADTRDARHCDAAATGVGDRVRARTRADRAHRDTVAVEARVERARSVEAKHRHVHLRTGAGLADRRDPAAGQQRHGISVGIPGPDGGAHDAAAAAEVRIEGTCVGEAHERHAVLSAVGGMPGEQDATIVAKTTRLINIKLERFILFLLSKLNKTLRTRLVI